MKIKISALALLVIATMPDVALGKCAPIALLPGQTCANAGGVICGDGLCYECCDAGNEPGLPNCGTGVYTTTTESFSDYKGSGTKTYKKYKIECRCPDGSISKCWQSTTYTSCNAGYYKSGSSCNACQKGTYKSSAGTATSCTSCTSPGTTASTGSTSSSDCYIPSGTTGSDSTGTYKYTSNCYWK